MKFSNRKRGECSVNTQARRIERETGMSFDRSREALRELLRRGVIEHQELSSLTGQWVARAMAEVERGDPPGAGIQKDAIARLVERQRNFT